MLIEIINLTKIFKDATTEHVALNELNFKINHGDFLAIIGKSGSGKSTLLHLLAALDKPTSGSISFNDHNISDFTDKQASNYRNRQVGLIFQDFHLLDHLTLKDNILLPLKLRKKILSKTDLEHYEYLIKAVELDHLDHRFPRQLSGGQRQRLAIVRALITKPQLLLADEPTGNLDIETGEKIIHLLKSLHKKLNFTLIVVTHDLDLARQADQTLELKQGHLSLIKN